MDLDIMSDSEILEKLEPLKKNPDDFEEIEGSFTKIQNESVTIYLVNYKKTNTIFIKKEFDFDENINEETDRISNSYDSDSNNEEEEEDFHKETESINQKNSIKKFKREVINLYKVQIKGLPFLDLYAFNFQIDESNPFIITRYMKGNTLASLIKNNFTGCKSPNTTKMIIFYGVAFALKILHHKEILHRDIKPENIFLNKKNEPFLGDFGFARVIQESTKLTEKTGTTYYMAKELFNPGVDVEPSEKIDSYSFAVTMLETLTLDLTIKNNENQILVKNNSNDNFLDSDTAKKLIGQGRKYIIPDDKVPLSFKKLIEDCWSNNPDERYPMDYIVKLMDERKLVLDGYDENAFASYINKLKNAEQKNERRDNNID